MRRGEREEEGEKSRARRAWLAEHNANRARRAPLFTPYFSFVRTIFSLWSHHHRPLLFTPSLTSLTSREELAARGVRGQQQTVELFTTPDTYPLWTTITPLIIPSSTSVSRRYNYRYVLATTNGTFLKYEGQVLSTSGKTIMIDDHDMEVEEYGENEGQPPMSDHDRRFSLSHTPPGAPTDPSFSPPPSPPRGLPSTRNSKQTLTVPAFRVLELSSSGNSSR